MRVSYLVKGDTPKCRSDVRVLIARAEDTCIFNKAPYLKCNGANLNSPIWRNFHYLHARRGRHSFHFLLHLLRRGLLGIELLLN